jgi:hypothetical protein
MVRAEDDDSINSTFIMLFVLSARMALINVKVVVDDKEVKNRSTTNRYKCSNRILPHRFIYIGILGINNTTHNTQHTTHNTNTPNMVIHFPSGGTNLFVAPNPVQGRRG